MTFKNNNFLILIIISIACDTLQKPTKCLSMCTCKPTSDGIYMDCSRKSITFDDSMYRVPEANAYHKIDFNDNKIKAISYEQLTHVNVNIINFSYNQIESITSDCFKSVFSIQTLIISQNKISLIQDHAFLPIRNSLEVLDLSANSLTTLPELKYLSNLKKIYLQNNNIKDFLGCDGKCSLFPISIKTIYAMSNKLVVIKSAYFKELDYLKKLDLNENQINTIENESFDPKRLSSLTLSGNYLSHLSSYWFDDIEENLLIDMSKQQVELKIDGDSFKFKIKNDANLTINFNSNRMRIEGSQSFCNRNKNMMFSFHQSLFTGINPCVLKSILYSSSNLKLDLTKTKEVECDCNLINYFRDFNENYKLRCLDSGADTSNCRKTSSPNVCQDYGFDCDEKHAKSYFQNSDDPKTFSNISNIKVIILIIVFIVSAILHALIVFIRFIYPKLK